MLECHKNYATLVFKYMLKNLTREISALGINRRYRNSNIE